MTRKATDLKAGKEASEAIEAADDAVHETYRR